MGPFCNTSVSAYCVDPACHTILKVLANSFLFGHLVKVVLNITRRCDVVPQLWLFNT